VGAVVVSEGTIVGEGWHERAGGPHAEINALRAAAERARGSDLYVSLEPCCHFGRTPPCTAALIEAGVARVVIGSVDPNPLMAGQGIEALRRGGVEVIVAGTAGGYERQNEVFVKYITRREPFVLLKSAISMNAKISAAAGERTRLTGAAAQTAVHSLRDELPLVAVGIGTVLIDDPLLTSRLEKDDLRQPVRLVVDSAGRLPLNCKLVETVDQAPVWLAATDRIEAGKRRELEQAGVEIIVCSSDAGGSVDLRHLMRLLGEREIAGMMVEGGARINGSLMRAGLVDKLVVFMAPLVLGGPTAVPVTDDDEDYVCKYEIASNRMLGRDLMIEAYPVKEDQCFPGS